MIRKNKRLDDVEKVLVALWDHKNTPNAHSDAESIIKNIKLKMANKSNMVYSQEAPEEAPEEAPQ